MINLLPVEEKQKLFSAKKGKLVLIFGIVILISLVCLALILSSIKFYILAETDYQKNMLARAEQANEGVEFTDANIKIQKYNSILQKLGSFYKEEIYFSGVLKIITGIQGPDELYLSNFSLSRDAGGKVKASVSGASNTRDDLLIYKKNIEDNKKIKNIYFSPESWISPENVNFSLMCEIVKDEEK